MAQLKISETQRTKGVILALLSTLSFSFMMIFAALNSPEIPLWEQTFFRNLIGIFVASFILIKNHQPLFGERKYWPQMFARSLFAAVLRVQKRASGGCQHHEPHLHVHDLDRFGRVSA